MKKSNRVNDYKTPESLKEEKKIKQTYLNILETVLKIVQPGVYSHLKGWAVSE